MTARTMITLDANEAVAQVAYRLNEVMAIYPITPSSAMGEHGDAWAATGRPNLWGTVPHVIEMQSEAGAAGALHGMLQTGALATTFTASQGLLLMIPDMFKIAGELLPTVFHVTARTIATHALSIFGDHSDVMATRSTGWALLSSASVQEAQDMAMIAWIATFDARVPFLHFFDGFRTSHEVNKIVPISDDEMSRLVNMEPVLAHRGRALSPNHPVVRGTAQNPDVFFQAREACNPYYIACPGHVRAAMQRFGEVTGRHYDLYEYEGAPDAERVIILMGSGAETASEAAEVLNASGGKVGVVRVHLYRPLSAIDLVNALPPTVLALAVLDRTKEPGALGEPLYQDVIAALHETVGEPGCKLERMPKVIGGRYGLSSKEFTPAMVKSVYDELGRALAGEKARNHFTVGINDDVTHLSLEYDASFSTEPDEMFRGLFYGLGADGTVSANKNSIKIIGEKTDNFAQGFFVYDSKKSGSITISHLRFGPRPIRAAYLVTRANFIACHNHNFLEQYDMLQFAEQGATFLLNCPWPVEEVWGHLPAKVQAQILEKQIKVHVIDATHVARETGMGQRINTIMQTCFFSLAGIMPAADAIALIKKSIEKTYGAKGVHLVELNCKAVDQAIENLKLLVPPTAASAAALGSHANGHHALAGAPQYVREVTSVMLANEGDALPVSAFEADGTFPTATTQWEKRNLAQELPVWDADICIQCGKCAVVCPHATIRLKAYPESALVDAPASFKSVPARGRDFEGQRFTIQLAPEDCTGCGLCFEACPVKNKTQVKLRALNMEPQAPIREQEAANWEYFLKLPEFDRSKADLTSVKGTQLMQPLFEFSGACSGCGETPYLKLLTQLFGDRAMVANATGCSSIYGGNLPTTPWAQDGCGRGPSWANSLFEDNAEFGLGFRVSVDKQIEFARELLGQLAGTLPETLINELLNADQHDEYGIAAQRARVADLKKLLAAIDKPEATQLAALADVLVKRSIWIVGGDGWAYDIGYGGLDHVLASGRNVNILVLDTEVYSNTGGQASKSTPLGAVAKFAAGGKRMGKKDLAQIAMTYGHVYVATVAMGSSDSQTVRAMVEAESYDGPSLIIAYSHCIAHGYDLRQGLGQQKAAVDSGHFPLMRFDPRLADAGQNPLRLDSKAPKITLEQYAYYETRYRMLANSQPETAKTLLREAQANIHARWAKLSAMATPVEKANGNGAAAAAPAAAAKE